MLVDYGEFLTLVYIVVLCLSRVSMALDYIKVTRVHSQFHISVLFIKLFCRREGCQL